MWYDYTVYGLEILNKIPTSGIRLACGKDWWATGTKQKQKILRRGGKNIQKNCTKKIFMTQIIMMV